MRLALLLGLAVVSCSKQLPPAASSKGGPAVREISVTSKGFEPARVEVPPGQPVVLRFTRKVKETCADAVEVKGDPVRHMLPLDTPVDVRVKAPDSGELAFACPMQMIHGAVVVVQQ
jgi:plastocyanin domain-containing protein